ncbi:MAG TPA: glycosyl hydrolase family 28-related protein, partial [Candidatus Synoicihabitans sp.]|nr:glycosyl hydrolase family 28-related protein [Candidatus Synoicihabitans sp.]
MIVFAAGLSAAPSEVDGWEKVDEIVRTIELPRIPSTEFPITRFGAQPGSDRDARPAIEAAIDAAAAAGGGRVIIPAGRWLSDGPIHLKSRIELHVADGATLLFGPDPARYLPVVLTRWEGTEMYGYSPLIYAREVEDVAITGRGVIDGNGESGFHAWTKDAEADFQRLRRMGNDGTPARDRVFGEGTHLRPSMIQFFHAKRVLLE